jgi:hypothetical protein
MCRGWLQAIRPGFDSRKEQEILLSQLRSYVFWHLVRFLYGNKQVRENALSLTSMWHSLRMYGAVPPLPHTLSWCDIWALLVMLQTFCEVNFGTINTNSILVSVLPLIIDCSQYKTTLFQLQSHELISIEYGEGSQMLNQYGFGERRSWYELFLSIPTWIIDLLL